MKKQSNPKPPSNRSKRPDPPPAPPLLTGHSIYVKINEDRKLVDMNDESFIEIQPFGSKL